MPVLFVGVLKSGETTARVISDPTKAQQVFTRAIASGRYSSLHLGNEFHSWDADTPRPTTTSLERRQASGGGKALDAKGRSG